MDHPEKETEGLSQKKLEELRRILPQLEEKARHYKSNPSFAEVLSQLEELKKALSQPDQPGVGRNVLSWIGGLATGVLGNFIFENMPESLRHSLRDAFSKEEKGRAPDKLRSRSIIIIKADISDGPDVIDVIIESSMSALILVGMPFIRIWCESTLAVYLRLYLNKSWVEHPTEDEISEVNEALQKGIGVLTRENAAEFKRQIRFLASRRSVET